LQFFGTLETGSMFDSIPVARCDWSGASPEYIEYHDREWGVPTHDDRRLFEFLVLEGAQAGLSWLTILRKREGYRRAFAEFDAQTVASFDERTVEKLLGDASIVRNRRKIEASIQNARAYMLLQSQPGGFHDFVWKFVDGEPVQNTWTSLAEIPATTAVSDKMSKELKRAGFSFVGSTVCYAYMQATGMVNDHVTTCFRWQEVQEPAGG
jgi:DNA-3-methyladenine glycosylase I